MSTLQYPESAATTPQLQVWNNAAFDGDENLQGFSFPVKASWSTLRSSDCTKENLSPAALNSSTPFPSKPLLSTAKKKKKGFDDREDENKIDDEIQEIENEIKRLSFRLESLRLQKAAAAAAAKTAEKRGQIVPAKFMEQKQSSAVKVIEETPKAKVSVMRRGVSLGPAEISAGGGRFSRWPGKVNANAVGGITPVPATTQSRRKSCFWKLEEVDEELKGGVNERKKTLSLSPKSKRIAGRRDSIQGVKHVAATVRKSTKKEDSVVALVQPRKLFNKEGEKSSSVSNKKPAAKAGRVVASRYNSVASADARKRSWPENDKDDAGGGEGGKRRASLRGNGHGSEVRVKKRWEIPAQVVVFQKSEEMEEEKEEEKNTDVLLPKIRTLRRNPIHSPRDSGAAKRVADLTGKRSYFCPDEHMEGSVCQVLNFAEEAADDE